MNLSPFSPPGVTIWPAESILGSCRGSGLRSPGGAGATPGKSSCDSLTPCAPGWGTGTWSCPTALPADGTTAFPHHSCPPWKMPSGSFPPCLSCFSLSDPQMHIHSHLGKKITGSPLTPLSPLSPLDPWREIAVEQQSNYYHFMKKKKYFFPYNQCIIEINRVQ